MTTVTRQVRAKVSGGLPLGLFASIPHKLVFATHTVNGKPFDDTTEERGGTFKRLNEQESALFYKSFTDATQS